jgi:hypothetical protein
MKITIVKKASTVKPYCTCDYYVDEPPMSSKK